MIDVGHRLLQLADFGLSRVLDTNGTHVSTQTYGTLAYQPAELLRDGKLTKAVDVYSFGMIMWELCAGRRLFENNITGQVGGHKQMHPLQLKAFDVLYQAPLQRRGGGGSEVVKQNPMCNSRDAWPIFVIGVSVLLTHACPLMLAASCWLCCYVQLAINVAPMPQSACLDNANWHIASVSSIINRGALRKMYSNSKL